MNVIEMQDITKTLGTFRLELPALTVQQGYITGFIGENGSGKTTTMKLLMNMLFADSGHIRLLNMDMPAKDIQIKQHIGTKISTKNIGSIFNWMITSATAIYPRA